MKSYYAIERSNAIYHHGIKGQKWGIRRYQNKDGTLTEAGKRRYMDKNGNLTDKGKKLISDTYQKMWKQYNDEASKYESTRMKNADLEADNAAWAYANSKVDAINAKLDKKYPKYADGTLTDDDELWFDVIDDFEDLWDKEYFSKYDSIIKSEQKATLNYINNLPSKKNAEKLINEYGMTEWNSAAYSDAVLDEKTGRFIIPR